MMANRRELFETDPQLQRFLIANVRPMGRQLGVGSYGSVEELEVSGIVCAGKKIHETLIEQGNFGADNIATKYVEECQLMSDLRHPHLVQFLGVCFLPNSTLPVLVMERLLTSLDELLEGNPDIPLSLKRSILADVARGLVYLHSRSPPVIHRDLSAKNVLLNSAMVAKISDLGNARIVNFQPGQLARTLSRIPGTMVYMPPEAFESTARYGPSLDSFSFGHLSLFTITQVFPANLLSHTYRDPGNPRHLFGRSEVERRDEYIQLLHQQLGEHHPLVQLVKQCLEDEPSERPSAEELLWQLEGMRAQIEDPYEHLTKLEAMKLLGQKEAVLQGLQSQIDTRSSASAISRREVEALQMQLEQLQLESAAQLANKEQELVQKDVELSQLEATLRGLQELNAAKERMLASVRADRADREAQVQEKEAELLRIQTTLTDLRQQSSTHKRRLSSVQVDLEAREATLQEKDAEITALQTHISELQAQNAVQVKFMASVRADMDSKEALVQEKEEQSVELQTSLRLLEERNSAQAKVLAAVQADLEKKEAQMQEKETETKESEAEINRLLGELKNLRSQLHRIREVASVKDQPLAKKEATSPRRESQTKDDHQPVLHPGVPLKWERCADLPVAMENAQAVVVGGRVYVGGGRTTKNETASNIYVYDLDTWEILESPAQQSALTAYQEKLVLIGGTDVTTKKVTNEIWVFEEIWVQPLPPMPTSRRSATAVTVQDNIIVAGGYNSGLLEYLDIVEVYSSDQQWCTADRIPKSCYNMKSVLSNDFIYLMGGAGQGKWVFQCSVKSLLETCKHGARARSPSPVRTANKLQSTVWKRLPNSPFDHCCVAAFGGAIAAIGGERFLSYKSSVYMYDPLTHAWVHAGEMPVPTSSTCTTTLPDGELLVIGGSSKNSRFSPLVYKATLEFEID